LKTGQATTTATIQKLEKSAKSLKKEKETLTGTVTQLQSAKSADNDRITKLESDLKREKDNAQREGVKASSLESEKGRLTQEVSDVNSKLRAAEDTLRQKTEALEAADKKIALQEKKIKAFLKE